MASTSAKRLGTVAWWIGALNLIVTVLVIVTVVKKEGGTDYWLFLLLIGLLTPVCWALSYFLAGSFWRPPRE